MIQKVVSNNALDSEKKSYPMKADVAVTKSQQRLNEILIFLPALHPENQQSC